MSRPERVDEVRIVQGESGASYRLAGELGRGGQGRVYRARGGQFAIKLLERSRSSAELTQDKLRAIRRLPLDGLPVALPLEFLRSPDVGYVMELLTELRPLAWLIGSRAGVNLADWYYKSGGLRHRLEVLAGVVFVFARLHGRGLVYGDPSPNNTFVPGPGNHGVPWLIDADNMHYAGQPVKRPMCTPRYGAPELERGERSTSIQTDLHAIAVLVFQVLTLVHPLLGDSIIDGAPSEEVAALQGGLPWVDDITDGHNRSRYGVARACVLTGRLQTLAQSTFGPGRWEPSARATASAWLESLHAAAFATVDCTACRASFYADQPNCAWCGVRRPEHVWLYRQVVEAGEEPRPELWQNVAVLQQGGELNLSTRGDALASYDMPACDAIRVQLQQNALRVLSTGREMAGRIGNDDSQAHTEGRRATEVSLSPAGQPGPYLSLDDRSGYRTLLRCERVS